MDVGKNSGKLDRTKFAPAHNDSLYVQALFENLEHEEIKPGVFSYGPCWAILDPGMTMEAHNHAIPELYVFVRGRGVMRLDDEKFDVENGMAVNIPPNVIHEVTNSKSAIEPIIWVSIGLKE